ncbi:MAG: trypsin-like peptidase domain-containing protein, partial [Pseudomonadota bacterium]
MTFVLRLFIVLALALSAPALSVAQNLQTIAAQAELSTARVITRSGTGSGFVVGKGTNGSFFLVTNHHVIEGETEAVVAFGLKDRIVAYGAKVKNASSELDMAVLHVFP